MERCVYADVIFKQEKKILLGNVALELM